MRLSDLKKVFQQKQSKINLSDIEKTNGYLAMDNEDCIKLLTAYREYYKERCANYLEKEDQIAFKVYDGILKNIKNLNANKLNVSPRLNVNKLQRETFNEKSSGIV